jgi:peptidoglycan-associated lipoprotein
MMKPRVKEIVTALAVIVLVSSCAPRERRDEIATEDVQEEPIVLEETSETVIVEDRDLIEPEEVKPALTLRTIYFELDRYAIRAEATEILKGNADGLESYPDQTILIEGHCCPLGTNEYNMALGWKRANAARDYLHQLGVEEKRMTTTSYGEERVVETDPDRYEWNRRCEFKVVE